MSLKANHRYFAALDGVRALAALLVLWFHAAQEGLPLSSAASFGQTGVDLFFVLSGFLITSILLAARQGDWSEVRTFYLRRSFRIFPLYYLALFVCSVFFFRCDWPYWIYLQNIWNSSGWHIDGPAHLWSLAVEEQFYLVWPFVVLFVPRRVLLRSLAGMMVFSFVLRLWLASLHHDVFAFTLTRLDGLAAGAILAVLQSRGELQRWRGALLGLGLASGAVIIPLTLHFRNSGSVVFTAIKYTLLAGLYGGVLGWLLCSPDSRWSRALSVRPLRFVGRVSYGLYVWHPFVIRVSFRLLAGRSPWLKGPVALAGVLAAAILSYYGYERHFLRLKDRFASEPRVSPQAPLGI